MKNLIFILISLTISCSTLAQEPVTVTMANVFGDTPEGRMPTHTPRIQELFAKKVEEYTDGQVKWQILKGKQQGGISVFRSPALTAKGEQIQATNVPAFFLPRVPEMSIQAIPFLFDGVDPVIEPEDFNNKIINGFDKSWNPMWTNITPKERRFIGTQEAWTGALANPNSDFDINIGMIQNNHRQRLHERFKHTTLVYNFYNIFYTMMINLDLWNSLTDFQRGGIERAVSETQNATIAYQIDTTLWALQLNQSEGTKMHFLSSDQRKRWKAEFYPKMVKSVIAKSSTPDETREMIKKIEALVDDLRWQ